MCYIMYLEFKSILYIFMVRVYTEMYGWHNVYKRDLFSHGTNEYE